MNQFRLGCGFVAATLMVAACGSSDSESEGTIPRTLDSAKTDSGADAETTTDGGRGGGDASTPASYAVGGVVSGLGSAGLVLQNNAGDDLPVAADGAFAFTKKLATGAPFAVTIKTQPATQTCSVSGENGTVGSGDVSSVVVNCAANKYTIGGIASGLLGTAVLQNNGGNDLNVNANGAFAFATALETGAAYAVTIKTQPTVPSQVCALSNTSGTVASAKVTNVALTCVTNKFKIKLAVSGLLGAGLKLRNKGGDELAVGADGTYEFATAVDSGQTYAVTVNTQPAGPSQTCTVTNANGTVGAADVANVTVACATNSYKIGGNVTGMVGGTLVLQDNLGDDLNVAANGAFTFATKVLSGSPYAVSVLSNPTGRSCSVTAGSGTVAGADVADVAVACVPLYTFSGVQQNLPVASLTGWSQCYIDTYDKNDGQLAQKIVAACTKSKILMACRPTGAANLALAANAPRVDAFFEAGTGNVVHDANGVGWYFNNNYSMGFAPQGEAVSRNSADTAAGARHMSWHTHSNYSSGYRCGDNYLNGDASYERLVYQAD